MFEYESWDLSVFINGFSEDEDVVKVYAYDTFANKVLEYVIHYCLKGGRGVGKSKEHHQRLE